MNNNLVTKAILPVAGSGTRLLPLTLYQPKALIPIADRPMIYYALEELMSAGVKHIILIVPPDVKPFKKYIEHLQKEDGYEKLGLKFDFIVQKKPDGNGTAVALAKHLLKKNEPFFVYFCDYITIAKPNIAQGLVKIFKEYKKPVIPVEKIPSELIHGHATVKLDKIKSGIYQIRDIIEKPKPEELISNFSIMPYFILTEDIIPFVAKTAQAGIFKGKNKEVALADVVGLYCRHGNMVHAWEPKKFSINAGLKNGLMEAQIYFSNKFKKRAG